MSMSALGVLLLVQGLWLEGWLAAELDPVRTLGRLPVSSIWTNAAARASAWTTAYILLFLGVFFLVTESDRLMMSGIAAGLIAIQWFLIRPQWIRNRALDDGYFQLKVIPAALRKHFHEFPNKLRITYAKSPELPRLNQSEILNQSLCMLQDDLVMTTQELLDIANQYGVRDIADVSDDFLNAVAQAAVSRGAAVAPTKTDGLLLFAKPRQARPGFLPIGQ